MDFQKGDHVRLTDLARRQNIVLRIGRGKVGPEVTTGVVMGFGNAAHLIRVLVDGQKHTRTFSREFWEKV